MQVKFEVCRLNVLAFIRGQSAMSAICAHAHTQRQTKVKTLYMPVFTAFTWRI